MRSTAWTCEAKKSGDPESVQMNEEVLEIIGKRCRFGAIEIESSRHLSECSVFEIVRAELSQRTQVPRVCRFEAPAYDPAEQLILDPKRLVEEGVWNSLAFQYSKDLK